MNTVHRIEVRPKDGMPDVRGSGVQKRAAAEQALREVLDPGAPVRALDDQRELTPLGRDLARLPIDPTLGRMLLQAQTEHAGRELLIIAAGLSIQDPRERPLDQREAADKAHRRFMHSQSDFLSLLGLWNGVHDQWE
jgi:ATP-dependent helicase HrpA